MNKKYKNIKIGICHYRVGKTDGVSLEIMKRKKMLENIGCKVILISGTLQSGADYIIPELEFDKKNIVKIKKNAFFKFKDYKTPDNLMNDIYKIAEKIKKQFLKIHEKEKFDYIILHNFFSHVMHIAVAKSFYDIAKNIKIKTISVNHDFYKAYNNLYTPQISEIQKYLDKYVPPKTKKIKHIVINNFRKNFIEKTINQKAMVFPDTFNFNQKPWVKNNHNKNFLKKFNIKENDLIFLQATRIVERKAIELAIDLIAEVEKNKKNLIGKTLYNGKKFTKNSNIIFVLAGFCEPASKEYLKKIKNKIKKLKIKAKFISNDITPPSDCDETKNYSLWDTYVFADIITFPSIIEGWGNQFIETIFAKKPIVMFEYPVFKADIKPEGYKIISLGDQYINGKDKLVKINNAKIKKTANAVIKTLTNKNTNKILDTNWEIGKKFHGEKVLEKLLKKYYLNNN